MSPGDVAPDAPSFDGGEGAAQRRRWLPGGLAGSLELTPGLRSSGSALQLRKDERYIPVFVTMVWKGDGTTTRHCRLQKPAMVLACR
jgi:hypothetical protein